MSQVKGGRKPITQKAQTPNPYAGFFKRAITDLPEDIKKEIEAKGLEPRWIDKKEFVEAGNMHKNYWEPYKRDPAATESRDTMDSLFGNSPDGYIVRKGMVLATRPKQLGDAHREMIRERTEKLHGSVDNRGLEEDQD